MQIFCKLHFYLPKKGSFCDKNLKTPLQYPRSQKCTVHTKCLKKPAFGRSIPHKVQAPLVAQARKAGQFVIEMYDEDFSERIPAHHRGRRPCPRYGHSHLSDCRASTHKLALKNPETALSFWGHWGTRPTLSALGWAVCVGGGIGLAPLHPIAKALKEAGTG
jgi:ferredoxin--NADP+ reductase